MTLSIGHEVIRASAGAGKTYQLVTRYVGLLAAEVPPEEIVALTFSRKAAGEILDKIVERLASAATGEPAGARALDQLNAALREGGTRGDLDRGQVLGMLRRLLARLHLCRVGTLDSFFVGVVRAFPFELGLSGDFRIIDGYAARLARQEVLARVLSEPRRDDRRSALLEGYKQATFGQERKGFEATLDGFVSALHEVYLEAPWEAPWGRPESIWGGEDPWRFGAAVDPDAEAAALRDLLLGMGLPDKVMGHWEGFFEEILILAPGDALPAKGALSYMLEKLGPVADALQRGRAEVKLERTEITLTGDAARHAWRLLGRLQWAVLSGAQVRTRGLWQLLHAYEAVYHAAIRRSGRLGFRDVMHLLAPADGGFGGDAIAREYVAYRMDGAFSHWLLDEFQDTSTLQWRAIRDLIDEVLQDPEGRRTLFYVGDVKQAIYNWRGGNASLFQRILDHYSPEGDRIRERPLFLSWRSAPPVIDAVNRVFEGLESRVGAGAPPTAALEAWAREWRVHGTARRDLTGCVTLYELPRLKLEEENRAARARLTAALLADDAPHRRGLSVAVLVRNNAPGKAIADHLRAAGLPAVWEGDAPVADNSLVTSILSLARVADHPGDVLAWEHLRMGPLWPGIEADTGGDRSVLVTRLLDRIHAGGFEALVREWTKRWARSAPLDPFLAARAEALATAAREVDGAGETRCLEFIDFVRERATRDLPVRGAITVLTMHRSKGLQWDHVILPDLQASRGSGGGPDLLVDRAGDLERTPRWVLSRPPRAVCGADPELLRHLEAADAEEWYEQLCLLYVAMTRAKRGLDVVLTAPSKTSTTPYLSTIVRAGLVGDAPVGAGPEDAVILFRTGDPGWIRANPEQAAPLPAAPPRPCPLRDGGTPRRRPTRTPSSVGGHPGAPAGMFSAVRDGARERGVAVHGLFEAVEWLDDVAPRELVRVWRARQPVAPEGVEEEFLAALERPALRAALVRPAGAVEVWRERSFEVLLDGDWVSGAFDRVVLVPDPGGGYASATILDFKTDRTSDAELDERVEAHRPQMELYRKALAAVSGLDRSRVRWTLVFTWSGVTRSGP
ncbi:MAG: UvrD-helicase domain-containing protein [Pseudomonadota bacterium]